MSFSSAWMVLLQVIFGLPWLRFLCCVHRRAILASFLYWETCIRHKNRRAWCMAQRGWNRVKADGRIGSGPRGINIQENRPIVLYGRSWSRVACVTTLSWTYSVCGGIFQVTGTGVNLECDRFRVFDNHLLTIKPVYIVENARSHLAPILTQFPQQNDTTTLSWSSMGPDS